MPFVTLIAFITIFGLAWSTFVNLSAGLWAWKNDRAAAMDVIHVRVTGAALSVCLAMVEFARLALPLSDPAYVQIVVILLPVVAVIGLGLPAYIYKKRQIARKETLERLVSETQAEGTVG